MEQTITLTMTQLRVLLVQQKIITGEYITRNLSTYAWYNTLTNYNGGTIEKKIDLDLAKDQLQQECGKAPLVDDYNVLAKYLK